MGQAFGPASSLERLVLSLSKGCSTWELKVARDQRQVDPQRRDRDDVRLDLFVAVTQCVSHYQCDGVGADGRVRVGWVLRGACPAIAKVPPPGYDGRPVGGGGIGIATVTDLTFE